MVGDKVENCENSQLTLSNILHFLLYLSLEYQKIMSYSDVYNPLASSSESCDASYSSSKEEIEVASTVQP